MFQNVFDHHWQKLASTHENTFIYPVPEYPRELFCYKPVTFQ